MSCNPTMEEPERDDSPCVGCGNNPPYDDEDERECEECRESYRRKNENIRLTRLSRLIN